MCCGRREEEGKKRRNWLFAQSCDIMTIITWVSIGIQLVMEGVRATK